jgi:DNA modification methylase
MQQLHLQLNRPEHVAKLYLEHNPTFGRFTDPSRPPKRVEIPYSLSISAGKNTYAYDAHTYHTKVPPQGIVPLIEYYTRPGDVVLDPFCGSGTTGIAATDIDRTALLSDLSPAAVFIAYNLNTPMDAGAYMNAVHELMAMTADLEERLYTTHCRRCGKKARMLYTVWTYGFICNYCGKELLLWDVARDEKPSIKESKIRTEFPCPSCKAHLRKRNLQRTKRYPVRVGYKCCESGLKESCSDLDAFDNNLISEIESAGLPPDLWFPDNPFPQGVNTRQPIAAGITTVSKCYTTRALFAFATLWRIASTVQDEEVKAKLLFTLTSLYQRITVFSEFRFWGGSGNIANYNVPAVMNEQNVFKTFLRKAKTISLYFREAASRSRQLQVSTQSACNLRPIPDASVDYIFTDPPFGANINYSEMNFLWESWLRRFTHTQEEAIVNPFQQKNYEQYEALLFQAFREMRRVLKDGAWLTLVFHNSSEKAWKALQDALSRAGFGILGTQIFDKKQGTFKMFVSENAVGYDLVLHCQKAQASQLGITDPQQEMIAAKEFIKSALADSHSYTKHYLHVSRKDEFDYRRLYSEWLAGSISNSRVGIDFESFRSLADLVKSETAP